MPRNHFETFWLYVASTQDPPTTLQSQSNFGKIKSLSEKSEEYYLYALVLYGGKHDTENVWLGRAINAIYETSEKSIEICAMFDSVNSHMCQGDAYSYMYIIEKISIEKAEEQFNIALDMAGSEEQKLKIQEDIDKIYEYYKLPME